MDRGLVMKFLSSFTYATIGTLDQVDHPPSTAISLILLGVTCLVISLGSYIVVIANRKFTSDWETPNPAESEYRAAMKRALFRAPRVKTLTATCKILMAFGILLIAVGLLLYIL